jgi:hypothetical protein
MLSTSGETNCPPVGSFYCPLTLPICQQREERYPPPCHVHEVTIAATYWRTATTPTGPKTGKAREPIATPLWEDRPQPIIVATAARHCPDEFVSGSAEVSDAGLPRGVRVLWMVRMRLALRVPINHPHK